jgi:hypothetical protein
MCGPDAEWIPVPGFCIRNWSDDDGKDTTNWGFTQEHESPLVTLPKDDQPSISRRLNLLREAAMPGNVRNIPFIPDEAIER